MILAVTGWLIFATIFAAVGALLTIAVALLLAISLLHPPRMNDGKALYVLRRMSPADLGLPFEQITFDVLDAQKHDASRIKLAGWWIPAEHSTGRCAVLLHGYADAKIGSIAWAPMWRSLGFNVLAIDLRAHGESGGTQSTGGFFEQHDLVQSLDQLRTNRPNDARKIVLMGISLGSAVALSTASIRPDLADAIVLDCPFVSFANAATSHARRLGAPTHLVMPLALKFAQWISGARFDEVNPLESLRTLRIPVLIVQSANDSFVDPADARAIAAVAKEREGISVWIAEDSEHLLALAAHPDEYARRLREFVDRALHD